MWIVCYLARDLAARRSQMYEESVRRQEKEEKVRRDKEEDEALERELQNTVRRRAEEKKNEGPDVGRTSLGTNFWL